MEITDPASNPALANSRLARSSLGIRWLLGVPLLGPTGEVNAIFAVLDTELRELAPRQRAALVAIGRLISDALSARKATDHVAAPLSVPQHSAPSQQAGESSSLLRSHEVAALLDVTERTVINWAASGKLACLRTVGGHLRFRTEDVVSLLEANSVGRPPTSPSLQFAPVADLLQRVKGGDDTAWTELKACFDGIIAATGQQYRLTQADVVELQRTTWSQVRENLHLIEQPERLGGWVATIARRESLATSDGPLTGRWPIYLTSTCPSLTPAPSPKSAIWCYGGAWDRLKPRCQELLSLLMTDDPLGYKVFEVAGHAGGQHRADACPLPGAPSATCRRGRYYVDLTLRLRVLSLPLSPEVGQVPAGSPPPPDADVRYRLS